jgi:hypothetical protein
MTVFTVNESTCLPRVERGRVVIVGREPEVTTKWALQIGRLTFELVRVATSRQNCARNEAGLERSASFSISGVERQDHIGNKGPVIGRSNS